MCTVRNTLHVQAVVAVGDTRVITLVYDEAKECCIGRGSMMLNVRNEKGCGSQLRDYLVSASSQSKQIAVVDAPGGKTSRLSGNGNGVRYLQLALLNLVPDDNTMAFELAFSIEAECTPYGSQHGGIAQWIKDTAQHMMDRAATELAAAAGVSRARMSLASTGDMDVSWCTHARRFRCEISEQHSVMVEISISEQPDFSVDSIEAAIRPGDRRMHNILKSMENIGEAFAVDKQPLHFAEHGIDKRRDATSTTHQQPAENAGGAGALAEFAMSSSASASFVNYVKYTITQAAMHISLDDLRTYVEKVTACIAGHLMCCLKG